MNTHAKVRLGASDVEVVPVGVGTWAWGDKPFWGYETEFTARDVVDAFGASLDAGLDFFDTAEVYGHGESEKILGWLARKSGAPLVLATKYAPLRGRNGAKDLPRALATSLKRMGVPRVDLYQVHWCDTEVASIASIADELAACVKNGLARAVGVSNYSANEMREAHERLSTHGVALASNQVEYSLLHRAPETDGVLAACRELNVTLLAYSPLAQGLLTGRYGVGRVPPGRRGTQPRFAPEALVHAERVVAVLNEIAHAREDARPEQIALAWLMVQSAVIPIAGAKTGEHAVRNAAALQITLTDEERERIDRVSRSAS
jgi:aryl-alcohol dehydrogenase-like predicted oxidoreductase